MSKILDIFKDFKGDHVVTYRVTAEASMKELASEYIWQNVIRYMTEELVKDLYPSVKRELKKHKPKMVKEITKQFIEASVERALGKDPR